MSRDGDPDDERTTDRGPGDGDDSDDEPAYPSYSWEGGESEWRADNEPTDRREHPADDRRHPADTRDERRRATRPPREDRRRPDDRRDHARRPRNPAGGDPTETRDGVGWNFDSSHPHNGARRDDYERRQQPPREPTNRLDGSDGVKHIDWRQKGAFDFAFSYPTQRGWGPLLKAGAIVLVSPLLVFLPLVFLFGYVFRLTRYAAQGRTQPEFADFGEMLTDGVGYTLAFTLTGAVWLVAIVAGAALHDVVAWTFALVGFYLFPAALTAYPVTGSITKTFSSSLTFDIAFSKHYVKHYLLYVVLLIVLRIVSSFSMLLFLIGIAWGWAFTYFANGAYWGFVYYKGANEGVLPSAEEVDQRNGY
ncbi:DUF4013 domain-containing protein [Haloarchaeobius litoreus]|uniref:DUF4013 domain-containing protein n=1 Tax=Haloarchaeobius litoreus TaxID=755306 RepID=A0ABD6DKX2_9EURY|nr:DUF4013 domain-containing protein [Haloarchaeobius litoreus]